MIPKIIHYCWFGGKPLPELALRCIESWRKYLPDYEIRQWNEENFDVNMIPFTAEAYRQRKFAFVSDYARFWILYKCGGVYFDTDVEVIRPMDDIIERGCFIGFEVDPDGENSPGMYAPRYSFGVNPGLGTGFSIKHPFLQKMIKLYSSLTFQETTMTPWLKTVVAYTTEALMNEGLKNIKGIQQVGDIIVYPREYFAPINVISGKLHIGISTYTIHHYMGTWNGDKNKTLKKKMRMILPEWVFLWNNRIKRRKYRIR